MKNLIAEALILGFFIALGLSLVDIKITVNIDGRPIIIGDGEIVGREPAE